MPVRIVGMIGVTPPSSDAALHVIEGGLSTDYLIKYARAHDDAGFDLALVGYTASSAEGFLVALHAAAHTKQLGYLVAHRPGFVAPTLMFALLVLRLELPPKPMLRTPLVPSEKVEFTSTLPLGNSVYGVP